MLPLEVEHFARDPHWTWFILFYFFFAGIAGGSYLIATLLRLRGERRDEPMARVGYYVTFIVLLLCPPLLIVDLGQPLRFWHMMWNLTPGVQAPNFKYWSPMSMGVWGLLGFTAFAAVSFVEVLVRDNKLRLPIARRAVSLLDGSLGRLVNIVGCFFAMFIAGYTGILLSVSNQPIWSDTWALGGLFLASGLSSAVAVLTLMSRFRKDTADTVGVLDVMERWYTALEVLLIVLFVLLALGTGALERTFAFPWLLLWLVAFASLVPGLRGLVTHRLAIPAHDNGHHAGEVGRGAVAVATRVRPATAAAVAVPVFVLIGVLCLRAAIILPVHHW